MGYVVKWFVKNCKREFLAITTNVVWRRSSHYNYSMSMECLSSGIFRIVTKLNMAVRVQLLQV